jgi:hypothetical protein
MEKLIFFFNAIILFAIFLVAIISFLKHHRNIKTCKITNCIFAIGIIFLILDAILALWLFGILSYSCNDYLFLFSVVSILQAIFLFRIIFLLSLNKNLFYLLFLYTFSFLSFLNDLFNFFTLASISSFLLMLILFIHISFRSEAYKRMGFFGVFYCLYSIMLLALSLVSFINFCTLSIFTNLGSFILLLIFVFDLKKYSLTHLQYHSPRQMPYFFVLMRHFIFIIIITNFIFIGTIGIHELGHFGFSKFYSCEYRKVIYEQDFLRTDILCRDTPGNFEILLAGILLPIIISAILFFIGRRFSWGIASLILGFDLIASNRDFLDLGISDNLIMASLFLGLIFLIVGMVMLAKSKVDNSLD